MWTHLAKPPPPLKLMWLLLWGGDLESSFPAAFSSASLSPCSPALSSIERKSLGHPPDARLCRGAPPRCAHRDLVDAETCRESQGHLLSLQGEILNYLQRTPLGLSCTSAAAASLVSPVYVCVCVLDEEELSILLAKGRRRDEETSLSCPIVWLMSPLHVNPHRALHITTDSTSSALLNHACVICMCICCAAVCICAKGEEDHLASSGGLIWEGLSW